MLGFFRSKQNDEIKAFALTLADQLAKRYPPSLDNTPGKQPSLNRMTRIIEETCARAVQFRNEQRLGWLGKARLGNHFRWALTEAGYTETFVDFATEAVVVHISRPQR